MNNVCEYGGKHFVPYSKLGMIERLYIPCEHKLLIYEGMRQNRNLKKGDNYEFTI